VVEMVLERLTVRNQLLIHRPDVGVGFSRISPHLFLFVLQYRFPTVGFEFRANLKSKLMAQMSPLSLEVGTTN